jgi:serine-type D-Ala-D-Ala carboxypeptidase (penicillin-binding protein 5/6)
MTRSRSRSSRRFRCALFLVLSACLVFLPAAPASAVPRQAIPAKAAVVMDASGAVLYAKFPHAKLAPASTVKLVTAMVAIDHLDPAQKVRISRNASKVRSIDPRVCPDEEMTVSDLLHLALMKSVNSAAVALAEATAGDERDFAIMMNRKAQEIGAHETLFANASGLPLGRQYTTVSDLARILQAALCYPLIREILGKRISIVRTAAGRELFLESSNDLLWQEQNMIGGKTGYTGNARHCFVAAINSDKGPLYTAVLGARSRRTLWKSTLLLAEMGMAADLKVLNSHAPLDGMFIK